MGIWRVKQHLRVNFYGATKGKFTIATQQKSEKHLKYGSHTAFFEPYKTQNFFFFLDNLWSQDVLVFYWCYNQLS